MASASLLTCTHWPRCR